MRKHPDGSYDDEPLVRRGGVFVAADSGREVGPDDRDRVHGDYAEDPDVDDGVPGTSDDLPYDFGIENPEAADHIIDGPDRLFAGFGDTRAADDKGDREKS